jgi:hypothetical protein
VNAPDITVALLGVLRSSDGPLIATEIAGWLREGGHENADKKVIKHLLYTDYPRHERRDSHGKAEQA